MAENTLDEDQRAIARRQKIADMLMQQGAEPLQSKVTLSAVMLKQFPAEFTDWFNV